jgi:hypothetical protein
LNKTFEHLLGLNARDALAILKSAGIFDVRVTYTFAPQSPLAQPPGPPEDEHGETSMLRAVAEQFRVSDDQESPPDPLLEPKITGGMLSEARVVGVRDDGRQLIVARFKVSPREPRKGE